MICPTIPQRRASLAALFLLLSFCAAPSSPAGEGKPFRLGLNADNWENQVDLPTFRESIRAMKIEFIVWHTAPVEIQTGAIQKAIDFCREEGIDYLFNTEIVNYVPKTMEFVADGGLTYRWDLKRDFLDTLKDDPRFLGVVYDESLLMQGLAGAKLGDRVVMPYYAETSMKTPEDAFAAVADRIAKLSEYYGSFNADLVLETLFPDASFVAARGGAIQAVKLLKENYNDLMAMTARGAARQYREQNERNGRGTELWACVDLWYLDTFPNASVHSNMGKEGGHTPDELYEALKYAYEFGFDAAYIELSKGLMDGTWNLSEHGKKVVEFNEWRAGREGRKADWRTPPPSEFTVRRFPSGNPGGKLPPFLQLSSYGSRGYVFQPFNNNPRLVAGGNKYFEMDLQWWRWLIRHSSALEKVQIKDFSGTTFNTIPFSAPLDAFEQDTAARPYRPRLGLPETDFVDHTHPPLPKGGGEYADFYRKK